MDSKWLERDCKETPTAWPRLGLHQKKKSTEITYFACYYDKTRAEPVVEPEQVAKDRLTQVVVVVARRRVMPDVVDVDAQHLDGGIAQQERLSQ